MQGLLVTLDNETSIFSTEGEKGMTSRPLEKATGGFVMFQQHQIVPICTNSVDVKSLFQSKAQVFSFLEKLQSLVLNLLLMPGEGLTHQNTFSFNHTGPTMGCILEKVSY